jgi:hypothetical protein
MAAGSVRQRRKGASTSAEANSATAPNGDKPGARDTLTEKISRRVCCGDDLLLGGCSIFGSVVAMLVVVLALSAGWAAYDNAVATKSPYDHKPGLHLWRAISTLTGGLENLGVLKLGHKSLDQLVQHAKLSTGLTDMGGELHAKAALTNLQLVKTHLEASPNISTVLKIVVRDMVMIENLVKRLKVVDLLKRVPEIKNIEVRNPIVLIGSWRTGSTFLHNLLAEDTSARTIAKWEMLEPWTMPKPDTKAALHQYFDTVGIELTAPEMKRVHSYSLYQADECHIMFLSCLCAEFSQHLPGLDPVWDNYIDTPQLEQYEEYHQTLQALTFKHPVRSHIVLKDPVHT